MRSPGLVVRNVAAIVLTPAGPRSQGRSLTVEQARALLQAADGHPLEAAFIVALTCGLRPGELLGLPWQDVDLDQALPGRPSRRRGLLSAAACWGGRGTRRPIRG
jgi:integrase